MPSGGRPRLSSSLALLRYLSVPARGHRPNVLLVFLNLAPLLEIRPIVIDNTIAIFIWVIISDIFLIIVFRWAGLPHTVWSRPNIASLFSPRNGGIYLPFLAEKCLALSVKAVL